MLPLDKLRIWILKEKVHELEVKTKVLQGFELEKLKKELGMQLKNILEGTKSPTLYLGWHFLCGAKDALKLRIIFTLFLECQVPCHLFHFFQNHRHCNWPSSCCRRSGIAAKKRGR